MKIGIVGAGAIGGFLAAHLGAAGGRVVVLARGATLAAWHDGGVTLHHDGGRLHHQPDHVSDDPHALGPCDLVIVTVKGQDTAAILPAVRVMLAPGGRVVSFQNGLDGLERLCAVLGPEKVLAGVTYVPASVTAPGQIRHTGPVRRFVFGPACPAAASPVVAALADLGRRAGLEMEAETDPMPGIWAKFVMLSAFHLISGLTRLPLGGWIEVAQTRALYAAAMTETAQVAGACGVTLPPDLVQRNLEFSRHRADPRTRASMLDDLERGRPLELDSTIGWLIDKARDHGVPVPIHEIAHALLRPHLHGPPQVVPGARPQQA